MLAEGLTPFTTPLPLRNTNRIAATHGRAARQQAVRGDVGTEARAKNSTPTHPNPTTSHFIPPHLQCLSAGSHEPAGDDSVVASVQREGGHHCRDGEGDVQVPHLSGAQSTGAHGERDGKPQEALEGARRGPRGCRKDWYALPQPSRLLLLFLLVPRNLPLFFFSVSIPASPSILGSPILSKANRCWWRTSD